MYSYSGTTRGRRAISGFGVEVNDPIPFLQTDAEIPPRPSVDEYPELLEPFVNAEAQALRAYHL